MASSSSSSVSSSSSSSSDADVALITEACARSCAALENVESCQLRALIDAASDLIKAHCDHEFIRATYTDNLDGNGLDWIHVRNFPVLEIISCTITDHGGQAQTVAVANLDHDDHTARVQFAESNTGPYIVFPKGKNNIRMVYEAGYGRIPKAVQQACIQVVVSLYSRTSSSTTTGIQSERMGEYSWSKSKEAMGESSAISAMVEALLSKYVRY